MLTAGKISAITGIPRATVYRYLKALSQAGLIKASKEGDKSLYPDYALELAEKLYELTRITGNLESAIKALKSGKVISRNDLTLRMNEIEKRLDRLEKLLEGFIAHVSRKLESLEDKLSRLEEPKGLPAPKTPWWKRLFKIR